MSYSPQNVTLLALNAFAPGPEASPENRAIGEFFARSAGVAALSAAMPQDLLAPEYWPGIMAAPSSVAAISGLGGSGECAFTKL